MKHRVSLALVSALLLSATLSQAQVAGGASKSAKSSAAMPEPSIKVGDMAPDFSLRDQSGKEVALSSFRGKKTVVLAFAIFAFTGG